MTEEIKDKIKKAHYLKLLGNIPEGFVMVHEQVIEDLKDFDNWKDFKYNSNYIEEKNIEKVLSKDFEDGKIWLRFVKELQASLSQTVREARS